MKPANIIIAAAALILFSSLLSGCANQTVEEKASTDKTAIQNIEEARKVTKDVSLKLSAEKQNKTVTVNVVLDNPSQKPITSAETWLSYDPSKLKGVKIEVAESPFGLMAPYENTFDDVNGLVMIGRSNGEPVSTPTISVAKVVFELIADSTAMVDAYNYQNDLGGHISANMMLDGVPYNVLIKPESPALIIQNN
jgi:hypothetical protein